MDMWLYARIKKFKIIRRWIFNMIRRHVLVDMNFEKPNNLLADVMIK